MCKSWKHYCWQVGGSLGICTLTGEWCQSGRGWFSNSKVWRKCVWYLWIYLYVKAIWQKVKHQSY